MIKKLMSNDGMGNRENNFMKKSIAAAAGVLLAGALAGGWQAMPAQASTSVVVYTHGMAGNWQGPAVRPSEIGFGISGRPK